MFQAGIYAAKQTEQAALNTFFDSGYELNQYEEDYPTELKELRHWEIENFIRAKY
jgi:hypothetical protein